MLCILEEVYFKRLTFKRTLTQHIHEQEGVLHLCLAYFVRNVTNETEKDAIFATKMMSDLRSLSYTDRLRVIYLLSF